MLECVLKTLACRGLRVGPSKRVMLWSLGKQSRLLAASCMQEILPGNSNEDPRRPLTEQKWVCEVVLWVSLAECCESISSYLYQPAGKFFFGPRLVHMIFLENAIITKGVHQVTRFLCDCDCDF